MKGDDTRKRIIVRSARLFREQGYSDTSIQEIGKACNISSAALYYHFSSKQDILAHVVTYGLECISAIIAPILRNYDMDVKTRFRKALETYIQKASGELLDFFVTHVENGRYLKGKYFAMALEAHRNFYTIWLEAMNEGVKVGLYPPGVNLQHILLLSHGALREMIYWHHIASISGIEEIKPSFTLDELPEIFLEYRRIGVDL